MQIRYTLTSIFALAITASAALQTRDVYAAGYEAGLLAAREAAFEDYDDDHMFSARSLDDDDGFQLGPRGAGGRFVNVAQLGYSGLKTVSDSINNGASMRAHLSNTHSGPAMDTSRFHGGVSSSSSSSYTSGHGPYSGYGGNDRLSHSGGSSQSRILSQAQWPRN